MLHKQCRYVFINTISLHRVPPLKLLLLITVADVQMRDTTLSIVRQRNLFSKVNVVSAFLFTYVTRKQIH